MQGEDFAALYRAYLQRVLNYMRTRVGDEALAADLTAATFERAFAKRRQLRNSDAFAAWLFRIARSELAQHYRRRNRRDSFEALADVEGLTSDDPVPGEAVARSEELEQLLNALELLSMREREIIRLRFVAGLTNRSIAKVMRLSESNVAVILFRSIRKLRRILDVGDRQAGTSSTI